MNKRTISVGATVICFLFLAAPVMALTISPSVDATIFDGAQGILDGIGDYINAGGNPQAVKMSTMESRAILEYDLSPITQPITSAFLTLPVQFTLGPYPFTLQLYSYDANGTLTFSDYGAGSPYASKKYSGDSFVTFDVTPLLKATSSEFLGFNVRKQEQSPADSIPAYAAFGSLEHSPATFLSINETPVVTPEPASVVLFLVGGEPLV